jgi:hypothetical protein
MLDQRLQKRYHTLSHQILVNIVSLSQLRQNVRDATWYFQHIPNLTADSVEIKIRLNTKAEHYYSLIDQRHRGLAFLHQNCVERNPHHPCASLLQGKAISSILILL